MAFLDPKPSVEHPITVGFVWNKLSLTDCGPDLSLLSCEMSFSSFLLTLTPLGLAVIFLQMLKLSSCYWLQRSTWLWFMCAGSLKYPSALQLFSRNFLVQLSCPDSPIIQFHTKRPVLELQNVWIHRILQFGENLFSKPGQSVVFCAITCWLRVQSESCWKGSILLNWCWV